MYHFFPVDYEIAIPANVSVEAKSSSGKVVIRDVDGDVKVRSSSGSVELTQIGGAANAVVSSGMARLQSVGGNVDVVASSGRIIAQDIRGTFRLVASSGSVELSGDIRKAGEIKASSGDLRLSPGTESSFLLDAATRSGKINVDPRHSAVKRGKNEQTITVGSGGPTVNVRLTSGDIVLR